MKTNTNTVSIQDQLGSLIAASAKGDVEAFNQLYEYSFSTVEHECLRVLHNPIDAEDATQETYILIYQKLGGIKEPEKFLGWCRTIAHNASVNYIARRERKVGKDETRPPVSDDQYIGMDALDSEDSAFTPEEKAEQELVRQYLQSALNNIAPAQATCLALHEQGYTYIQISEKLSLPVGTVKSNVHYAKMALQKEVRRIEETEHIQIHGFSLVPVGGTVLVQMRNSAPESGETGFIQADTGTSEEAIKEEVWNTVSQEVAKSSSSQTALWKKIVSVVATIVIIVGGIIFAIDRAGKQDFATQQVSTTINQELQEILPNSPNTPRLAPFGQTARVQGNGTAQEGITATQAVTATEARQAEPEPTNPPETTREVFTNEARNMGNAVAGRN